MHDIRVRLAPAKKNNKPPTPAQMTEAIGAIPLGKPHVSTFAICGCDRGCPERTEGFRPMRTLWLDVVDESLQHQIKGQVVWID